MDYEGTLKVLWQVELIDIFLGIKIDLLKLPGTANYQEAFILQLCLAS